MRLERRSKIKPLRNLMIILAVARMFSVRKGVVKNFVKVTSEHLSQSLFLNKIPGSM